MIKEFNAYYEQFIKEEPIKYKYEHSIRVMNLSVEIGKSLDFNDEQLSVVKLIGLLHDYSRFEQWTRFSSFDDLTTFDHGDRAVELLFNNNEIEKYNLNKKYYKIVYDAIKYHNKYEIGKIDKESLVYCKIIRDADKLDILEQFRKSLFCDVDNDKEINSQIATQFFNHKSIKKILNESSNDNLVVKIALIYDLNFDYSFNYIIDNNIINKIEKEINMQIFKKYIDEIKKYMEERKC